MNFFKIALLAFTAFFIFSCKKNKDPEVKPEPTAVTYPDFSQLKVGNYWVYRWFEVNENGEDSTLNLYDSSYVEKDTFINNYTYSKIRSEGYAFTPVLLLRDSLHYIVNEKGKIQFSSQLPEEVFHTYYTVIGAGDTVCRTDVKMEVKPVLKNTPAGNILTRVKQSKYSFYPKWQKPKSIRFTHAHYAEKIGLVSESIFFLASPDYIEKRLLRYKVN